MELGTDDRELIDRYASLRKRLQFLQTEAELVELEIRELERRLPREQIHQGGPAYQLPHSS